MHRDCDICGVGEGTLFDRVTENGKTVEYVYCESCYKRALKSGIAPYEEAKKSLARRGKKCYFCGCTEEKFGDEFLFGCPECYGQMRDVAMNAVLRVQGESMPILDDFNAKLTNPPSVDGFKCANECCADDIVRDNVVSSRIRLARNASGMPFPHCLEANDERAGVLLLGAARAAKNLFDGLASRMPELNKSQKKVLLERHFISLPLANNPNGAVIIERAERPEMSVMINEEDHFREQCVVDGHNLKRAYARIHEYDRRLNGEIHLAHDAQFGYLTACPTNVGTGMRASEMLFLPALRRTGAIEDALKKIVKESGLTVRGYFGEGSDCAYDMYQISNKHTFGVSEKQIIWQVEQAALRLCYLERIALERLFKEQNTLLIDGAFRSYAVLTGAYSLTAQELMKLIVDVKIGVILGILPVKSTALLNTVIEQCSSSIEITDEGASEDERNKVRARIVRQTLAEAK